MRRLLGLLTLSVLLIGCEKEDRFGGFGIWDFANYEVVFTMVDPTTGEDLLDEENPSGLWLGDVSVVYGDKRYMLSGEEALQPAANMPQRLALRRTMTVKEGVRYNALSFGEFSPERDYHGESFTVEWGDGSRTEIAFDCYITWSKQLPTIHQRVWVDGREQTSGYIWQVDIERTLPSPTFDASYRSTDYSADGRVTMLQRATAGRGVDIVVMGDAYSDRLVANGAYMRKMREAVDAFFSQEPYRSLRHLFNVYVVDVVSESEGIHDGGRTALGVGFGEQTVVTGDYNACYEYVWEIDDIAGNYERINELVVLVVVNQIRWAGTCYMWGPYSMEYEERVPLDGDYGRGFSITYSCYVDAADLRYTVVHEAAGHGFAKLADEYFTVGDEIDDETKNYYLAMQPYGYYRNVDMSGDVVTSPWYRYTIDPRYAGTDVGYFEGGAYCGKGVWRSSWQSLMLYTEGGFNAISREMAYRRINRLAYGQSWQFDYEEFVDFDMEHRTASLTTWSCATPHDREPLPRPVMMDCRLGSGR